MGQNRAAHRDQHYANLSTDLLKSRAQKGREYSHWIDLTLNSHFGAVIPESYRTKVRCMSKSTFWGKKRCQKRSRGPAAPKPICWVKTKRGARRLGMKISGVKKSSSFIGKPGTNPEEHSPTGPKGPL